LTVYRILTLRKASRLRGTDDFANPGKLMSKASRYLKFS